jgi:hypothetical protein
VSTIDLFNDGSLFIGGNGNWFGSATTQHSRFDICGGLPITALTTSCTGGVNNSRGNNLLDYQSNGKYITSNVGRGINRLNADFTNDTTFNGSRPTGGDALFQYLRGLYVNPSDEIFVIGVVSGMTNCISGGSVSFNSNIYKLTPDGTIDTSYSGISLVYSGVPFSSENNMTSNNDPSGKVLVIQTDSFTGDTTWRNVFRLNTDGTPDPTFNTSLWSGYSNTSIGCSYSLPDGKYLVGGTFTNVSGITTQDQLVRLNNDGTLDTTFTYTGGTNVNDIDIDTYGNIFVIGYTGTTSFISKLTSNGNVITTRTLIQKTGFPVIQIAVNGGDVYVGGGYTFNDGVNAWQGLTKWDLNLNLNMCLPPTPTPTNTPTQTQTPTGTSSGTTPTPTPTPTQTPGIEIFTHGTVLATCSDYCNANYQIDISTPADANFSTLTIGDTIFGQGGVAGFVAYAATSTDTSTGTFRIAEIDSSGEIIDILVCSGGSCVPL